MLNKKAEYWSILLHFIIPLAHFTWEKIIDYNVIMVCGKSDIKAIKNP